MNGAQVGVLEQAHEVGLARLLQSEDGEGLELEVGVKVGRHLTNEALERALANKELRVFLVAPDLAQGHSAWAVTVDFLGLAVGWGRPQRRLRGQRPARRLAPRALARGLLRACHFEISFGLQGGVGVIIMVGW